MNFDKQLIAIDKLHLQILKYTEENGTNNRGKARRDTRAAKQTRRISEVDGNKDRQNMERSTSSN